MSFALILPASRPLLAQDASATTADADRAAAALRADYERWSRWALGVGAFVATVVGVFVAGGMIGAIATVGRAAPLDVAAVVVAAALAALGGATLVSLWRTGRALTMAAGRWLRAPYADGRRSPSPSGWVRARTVQLEPRILIRLVTASGALLTAVGGIALFVRDVTTGPSALTAPVLVIGLCAALSGCGQVGGVMRIVQGMSAADPVWAAIARRRPARRRT